MFSFASFLFQKQEHDLKTSVLSHSNVFFCFFSFSKEKKANKPRHSNRKRSAEDTVKNEHKPLSTPHKARSLFYRLRITLADYPVRFLYHLTALGLALSRAYHKIRRLKAGRTRKAYHYHVFLYSFKHNLTFFNILFITLLPPSAVYICKLFFFYCKIFSFFLFRLTMEDRSAIIDT